MSINHLTVPLPAKEGVQCLLRSLQVVEQMLWLPGITVLTINYSR